MLTSGRILRVAIPLFAAVMLLTAVACGSQAPVAPAASLAGSSIAADATTAAPPAEKSDGSATDDSAAATSPTAASQTGDGGTAAAVAGSPPAKSDGADYDVLQVSGLGKASGTPDLANLSLGVSVTDDTVADARSAAAEAMADVLAALKAEGVADADVTTSHFQIYQDYDYGPEGREPLGYTVSNGVNVKVRQIDDVAAVIDAAVAAGGDYIEFNHISFAFSDTAAMEKEARQAAVANMQEKAGQLAEFAGRELGDLKMLSEGSSNAGVFPYNRLLGFGAESAAMAYDTAIAVGEDDIAVVVHGVYELK